MKFLRIVAVSVCMAAAFGCTKKGGESAKKESGPVVAEVNGVSITKDKFDEEVKNLPPQLQVMAQSPEGKKELLDSLVVREIALQQAKKAGLEKSPEVEKRLAEVRDKIVVDAWLKKQMEEKVKVSDEDLKKVYEQYKDKFKTGDQVKASHILVKTEKEAKEIEEKLKKGESFEELAKKHSTDGSASKGGDLGWFGKGNMVPEFEKTAFGLKEGQTSGIVKTQFGYHIIKLTGKRAAGTLPFEEVKEQIKAAIMPAKQQELVQKLKDDLKKDAKITLHEDALGIPKSEKPAEPAKPAPAEKK